MSARLMKAITGTRDRRQRAPASPWELSADVLSRCVRDGVLQGDREVGGEVEGRQRERRMFLLPGPSPWMTLPG